MDAPPRCPHCDALVVDRRFPNCTTCRQALPAEWVLPKEEVDKLMAADEKLKARHAVEMRQSGGTGTHPFVDFLNQDVSGMI